MVRKNIPYNLYLVQSVYATGRWAGSRTKKWAIAQDRQGRLTPQNPGCVSYSLRVWKSIYRPEWEVYRGQMQGTYETHTAQSAVAEHSINTGHQNGFNSVSVLDRASGYMDRLVKEAIQIRLNHKNFNRDNGFTLSRPWNSVTKLFKHDIGPGKAATEPARQSGYGMTEQGRVQQGMACWSGAGHDGAR
jgi:hypothetical protein